MTMYQSACAIPFSDVDSDYQELEISDKVLRKIKNAWIAALIYGTLTLIFAVIAVYGSDATGFLDARSFIRTFIDLFLIFAFAFGIYKNSRIAATSMFVYFIASKIILMVATQNFGGGILFGILFLVFLYFFSQGVIGTFQYQKQLKNY
jgi:hypothetical protein